MDSRERELMKADGMLVEGKYAEALTAFRGLIEISEEKRRFAPGDFNWQILLLIRMQRAYRALTGSIPRPLEKLVKYYEIVARNHPGGGVSLDREEALICGRTLESLPKVGEPIDPQVESDLVAGIMDLLERNKDKYKLGVFFKKGF